METIRYLIIYVSKIFILLLLFTCCATDKHSDRVQPHSNFKVNLRNSFVSTVVREYVKEMQLDSVKVVIGINVETTSVDTVVYINHLATKTLGRLPTYYCLIDNYLVFIYTDVGGMIEGSSIEEEIDLMMKSRDLSPDTLLILDDSPTLKFSICEGNILRENDADLIELPCYLKIVVESGQPKLVRKQ